jgi:hypothetical protein
MLEKLHHLKLLLLKNQNRYIQPYLFFLKVMVELHPKNMMLFEALFQLTYKLLEKAKRWTKLHYLQHF